MQTQTLRGPHLGRRFATLLLSAFMLMAFATRGEALVIDSHAADGSIYQLFTGGGGAFPAQSLIVGPTTNANYNGVTFFQLPDRKGFPLVGADLKLTAIQSGNLQGANVDVWGLGYRTGTPAMVQSWISLSDTETRTGSTLGTNIGAATPTRIADNIVTPGNPPPVNSVWQTNTAQSATLLNFLNSLYDVHGAQAGDYAVFRINPDADPTQNNGNLRYSTANQGVAAQLTVQFVPEPSTLVLAAFGALGIGWAARRRRRSVAVQK